jgi:Acetyl-CoA dehydrogenase C-terminal like
VNGPVRRYDAEVSAKRFFMRRMLAETATHLARLRAGAASVMELADEAF